MDAVVAVARKRHQYIWRRKSGITDHRGSFSPSSNSRSMSVAVDGRSEAKSASNTPQTPKRRRKSKATRIKRKAAPEGAANFTTGGSGSELWAGPAHAISPPPSSLPTPNFSLGERRCSSLGFPLSKSNFALQPLLKSAPRESTSSVSGFPCRNDAATETLRRILNLDPVDDQKECRTEKVLAYFVGAR
ncbi:uncharacterized protein LOC141833934 [Curcuma longa]|uniref:uncharacterized protein LOC141833934 n=1 Tax=Curcuma longa TaxID=136217 RepID=UPI003D9DCC7C